MTKTDALNEYKQTRKIYIDNPTNENWKKFCNAKRNCMLLGIRVQKGESENEGRNGCYKKR